METTNITTSTPSLYADDIPLIESTHLSELEQYDEMQRDIERQEIEKEISDGYLFDSLCN